MAPQQEADEKYMRMAIDLATGNVLSGAGGPFGAVIVKDGKVVATGVNKVTASNDPTAHAEVTAIRNAAAALGSFELKGCTIYSSCEPCPMCLSAIYWARPMAVYYANNAHDAAAIDFDDAFIYEQIVLPHEQRTILFIQAMRQEGLEAFRLWKESRDKITY